MILWNTFWAKEDGLGSVGMLAAALALERLALLFHQAKNKKIFVDHQIFWWFRCHEWVDKLPFSAHINSPPKHGKIICEIAMFKWARKSRDLYIEVMYRPIMESNSPYGKNCESSVEKKCDRSGTVNLKEAFKGCPRVLCDQGLHVPYNTTVKNAKKLPTKWWLRFVFFTSK